MNEQILKGICVLSFITLIILLIFWVYQAFRVIFGIV